MVGSDEISSLQTFTMDTTSFCQDCGMLFTEKWMLQNKTKQARSRGFILWTINEKKIFWNLNKLEDILPSEGFPFIEYLQSIKEVHKMCIADVLDENYEILINEFKCKFYKLHDDFKLPMTLKIHVIVDHYGDYFQETGTSLVN